MLPATTPLADEHCVALTGTAARLADPESGALLLQIDAWQRVTVAGIERLERQFRFADFAGALGFTNAIGALAEAEDHHPVIVTQWGRVTVGWWTHVARGLHRNDLVMAAKCDRLYASAMS